jgi:predicted amidohydrolase
MILGTCQLNVCQSQEEIRPWLEKISAQAGPGFWLFPELTIGGFDYANKGKWISLTPDILELLAVFCKDTGHAIAIGLWEQAKFKLHNSLFLMLPHWSNPQCIYQKMHLFPLSREAEEFYPGQIIPRPIKWKGVSFGFGVCFDLRFPELFRYQNSQEQVDVFLLSAQWPLKRLEHWQTLLSARAIENQSYFLASNGCGSSILGTLAGHSCLITPWGEKKYCLKSSPGLSHARFELKDVQETRSLFQTGRCDFFAVNSNSDQA